MKKSITFLFGLLLTSGLFAQQYYDFLGSGHDRGITVTTSHNADDESNGDKSVDGFPIDDPVLLSDASRFLAQATMGYDYETIQMAAAMGFEAWLDEQLAMPRTDFLGAMYRTQVDMGEGEDFGGFDLFLGTWWEMVLKSPESLRQRIAYNLSQIMVVSGFGSDLFEDFGALSVVYYNVLNRNAFGNYRTLLSEVSQNPSMGIYLSHYANPKSDPANNIHPDENYAREVMQLFSIGLYELNNDGSQKLDANGQVIPTYDNDDIREFAKIFTGFGNGSPGGSWGTLEEGDAAEIALHPMKMYEEWHEQGEKKLLNGQIVPAGQTGIQDFEAAMDNLYNHPNVGPFIGKAMIQFLVSANPSPAYIDRVATAFNSGPGGRGDMGAMIKAILLDEEARSCQPLQNPTSGKLREPVIRHMGFLKAFKPLLVEEPAIFFNREGEWYANTGQMPMFANSVFNFYQPTFQPNGPIAAQDLVAPVFQIHNSSTSVGFINQVNKWTFGFAPFGYIPLQFDIVDEQELIEDDRALVERLNVLLACGQLSESTKNIIVNALSSTDIEEDKFNLALYLILISPDYAILK
ncbi:MAG: DUF1800 family protein [Bacteroidota bacterium]